MNRRSFLALISSALAIRPSTLVIPQSDDRILFRPKLQLPYAVWDTVILEPGAAADEYLFSNPIPTGFRIRSVGFAMEPSILLADMQSVIGATEFRICCDDMIISSGGVSLLDSGMGIGPHAPAIMYPELIPRDNFRFQVKAPGLDLSSAASLRFIISGAVEIDPS